MPPMANFKCALMLIALTRKKGYMKSVIPNYIAIYLKLSDLILHFEWALGTFGIC